MGSSITILCSNCLEDDRKGTYYEIYLDCGMLCFTKEQLERYYGVRRKYHKDNHKLSFDIPPDDFYSKSSYFLDNNKINTEIIENIKNGFEFTNNMGYTPYYCETCIKLESHFYFQMELKDNIYIPKYDCEKCKNHIEPLNIIYEEDTDESKYLP